MNYRIEIAARVLMTRRKINQNFVKSQTFVRRYSDNGDANKSMVAKDYQPIADFYKGKSVLITGGTGFLGKVLIEKLLYATNLDKIYVLIRDKKGVDVNRRLEYMFENPLFSRLKENKPENVKKIVPIRGDINLPNLGINQEDEKTLIEKVSVVFHLAATTMFNDPLPVVMNTNFEGTQRILNLTNRIKNVEALVYTSTAYCYPQKPVLLERIYPAPAKLDDVYKFMEVYGHNKRKTMEFIKGFPSTYNFSKAMTESYIADNHENIPTAIVRPSMVSPTASEPLTGWTDNWFAATAILYNCGKGWNVIIQGDKKNIADLIPVDYVANLSIITAARLNGSKEIKVYNCTTSSENPVTCGESFNTFIETSVKQGYNEVPCIFFLYLKSEIAVSILTIILQKLPAHIADIWLKIRGKKPKYSKIMKLVVDIRDGVGYYTSNSWIFRADKSQKLYSELSSEDQKLFPCNPADIVWSQYLKDYCNGIFKYLQPKVTARE